MPLLRAERYKRVHPEVLVHLQVENTRACCAAVAAGEANIAIVGGEVPRELEHLLQARGLVAVSQRSMASPACSPLPLPPCSCPKHESSA